MGSAGLIMNAVNTLSYTRTNTAIYVSDKMRSLMRALILHYGLDPQKLVDAWSGWVHEAARQWMETGDLVKFVIEFYHPGAAMLRCGGISPYVMMAPILIRCGWTATSFRARWRRHPGRRPAAAIASCSSLAPGLAACRG